SMENCTHKFLLSQEKRLWPTFHINICTECGLQVLCLKQLFLPKCRSRQFFQSVGADSLASWDYLNPPAAIPHRQTASRPGTNSLQGHQCRD
ncbi:MAG: hypothetical protein ACRCU2_01060, partial [Planktothrix sp.]